MKKNKKTEQIKQTKGSVYLSEGMTLSAMIAQLLAAGVTDFSKVKYDHNFDSSCSGGHGEDEYCYCETSYTDMRFDWEI